MAPETVFHRFPDLPREIQCSIWEIALDGSPSSFVWGDWPNAGVTLLAPLIELPDDEKRRHGEAKVPLIPYRVPEGLPETLRRFPLPFGFPERGDWERIDEELYEEGMIGQSSRRSALDRVTTAAKNVLSGITGITRRDTRPRNQVGYNAGLALLAACRLSRQIALRCAMTKTSQTIPIHAARSDDRPRFIQQQYLEGAILEHLFLTQKRRGSTCYVFGYLLGTPKPPARSRGFTHVAMRLADIEQCIIGRRLEFSVQAAEHINHDLLHKAEWGMWWRPDLGARARRPEANHPFHCTPATIISIYFAILHSLEDSHYDCDMDGVGLQQWHRWYVGMATTGKCILCNKPLLQILQSEIPKAVDGNGIIEVVCLLERELFERPEGTVVNRSHEI